ncbi:kinase-like domain-containing protein [Pterulicium gracile]|uniref:Kinase-like domain-containing protein n=1 Tax=Pterulicium gracile TaxID=1884261 RepID=A0A5C3QD77_9AGAR|nr:kinase-like domain-containing protein [Pterula gracilis]
MPGLLLWARHLFLSAKNGIVNFFTRPIRRLLLPYLIRRATSKYPPLKGGYSAQRLTYGSVLKTRSTQWLSIEAKALEMVRKYTTIPVPRTLDYWQDSDGGHLIIEYIGDGELLQQVWKQLTHSQRRKVCRTLRDYVQQLRELVPRPSKESVSSPNDGAFIDFRISTEKMHGPFPTVADFHDWRLDQFVAFGQLHAPTALRLGQLRQMMNDTHPIVFTHGDISPWNVLVKVDGLEDEDITVVALLDWEQAGWRPRYWEAVKFMHGKHGEWEELGWEEIFGGYEQEMKIEDELLLISGPLLNT